MLKIMVQGQALQLADDITLNLIIENPMMTADKIPTPYTTTIDIPATPDNLRFFGYPNRVNSVNSFKEYDSEVFFGAIKLLVGVLVVQQFNTTIKAYFRGVVVPDTVLKELNKLELQKYSFGERVTAYPDFNDPRDYAYKYKQLIFSSLSSPDNFIAAPVKIADADWPDAPNDSYFYKTNGLAASRELYLNFFNAREQSYLLLNTGVYPASLLHAFIFPMPFLYRILDSIFGSSLENNIFGSDELEKIVLLTSFHPGLIAWNILAYRNSGILSDSDQTDQNIDQYFLLNSYLPAVAGNEFFKDIFKIFCCTMFSVNGKFRILFNRDTMTSYESEAWTEKLIGSLSLSMQPAQLYQFGYSDITPEEQYFGYNLETLRDLHNATELITYHIVDRGIDQVMSKAKRDKANEGDPDRFEYEVERAEFGMTPDVVSDREPYDMKSGVSTLPVNLEYYWHEEGAESGIEFNTWAVPVWGGDRRSRPTEASILLYQGMSDTLFNGDRYPLVTPYNVDHFGNPLGALTLNWDGDYGLLNRFHKEFKEWIESDRVKASGTFLLSALDIRNLALEKKKHINGRLFFVEKLNVTIRKNSIDPAVIDLVEAPGGMPRTYISVHRDNFAKNNCGGGQSGSVVPFTKIYSSQVSQDDADAIAAADNATYQVEGQAWANAKGYCQMSGDVLLSGTYRIVRRNINDNRPGGRIAATLSTALPVDLQVDFSVTIYQFLGGYSVTLTGTFTFPAGTVNASEHTDFADSVPSNPLELRISGRVTRVSPDTVAGATIRY